MVLNADKCHFMFLGKDKEYETFSLTMAIQVTLIHCYKTIVILVITTETPKL